MTHHSILKTENELLKSRNRPFKRHVLLGERRQLEKTIYTLGIQSYDIHDSWGNTMRECKRSLIARV